VSEKKSGAGSHTIIRIVSVLCVSAVAAALLVGFFFGGDFRAAFKHVGIELKARSDAPVVDIASYEVTSSGTARVDGACSEPAIADKARQGAEFASKREAEDKCRARVAADPDASMSLRLDDGGTIALESGGDKCMATVEQAWTCLYDNR